MLREKSEVFGGGEREKRKKRSASFLIPRHPHYYLQNNTRTKFAVPFGSRSFCVGVDGGAHFLPCAFRPLMLEHVRKRKSNDENKAKAPFSSPN